MGEFDDYKGLFAEQGKFDIPAQLNVGLVFKPIPALSIAADWQRIYYGQIDSLNNGANAPTGPDTLLGADNGIGFGWDTINVYKIGVNYEVNDKFQVRAGYSHTKAPFKDADTLLNVIAPATIEDHVSVGFSYRINEKHGLTFAYTRALNNKVDGQNADFTGSQTGNVYMEQNIIDLGYTYNF
jgi:long-chain fatty acid transport protein